jgi:mRNA interferase RelE/StbE
VSQSGDVRISARAERDLARLPEKIAAACVEFIFGPLAETPYQLCAELRGQHAGLRSARRGSYRIIYKDVKQDRIDVVHVDHRGDVYR